MVGVKPGNSSVVMEYQVDEFTHTWLVENFVAGSYVYPGFMSKVSTQTHTPLKPRCGDYSLLGQAMADFEHGLDFIITDSIKSSELDAFFDESDTIPTSVSSRFLCSVSTIFDNSKLQFAPSMKCHKLMCQARALPFVCTTGRQSVGF